VSMKLILASANPGKQRELAVLLAPLGLELLLQSALGIESIEETGSSFVDNALLKARHAAERSGLPALAMTLDSRWMRSVAHRVCARRASPARAPAMLTTTRCY